MSEAATNIEILGEVRRGPGSVLKVSIGEFRGQTYIYCETWRKHEQDPGEGEPTHGGLTVRPDTLLEVLPLLNTALEKAKARRVNHGQVSWRAGALEVREKQL